MGKKKDGITDLTRVLVTAAEKFSNAEYSKLTQVIFALLHGVNYGYDTMDQRFLNDAQDLKFIHKSDKNLKKQFKIKKIQKTQRFVDSLNAESTTAEECTKKIDGRRT